MTATTIKNSVAGLKPKLARLELKTTGDTKELLLRAAAMSGLDMTAFVLAAAVERARDVITDHSTISLSLDGQRRFAEFLANPSMAPTQAMRSLVSLPDLPERRG